MKLKPRTTTKNVRALLYRRFTAIQSSADHLVFYRTAEASTLGTIYHYWTFNAGKAEFDLADDIYVQGDEVVDVGATTFAFVRGFAENPVRIFTYTAYGWAYADTTALTTQIPVNFAQARQYQINKYYFVKSFDFMMNGSISGTTGQYIKGNIVPITSFNIKHFDDSLNLAVDDLIVINGKLYSVENPEIEHKHQPRDYNVYFATLNNIL